MIKKAGIYKITNPIGQIYIGKAVNLKSRVSFYKKSILLVQYGSLIKGSISKYGYENHKIEIVVVCKREEISDFEVKMIEFFNSYWYDNKKYGLNLTKGGEGVLGCIRGIPVYQYDLAGKFISEFDSVKKALEYLDLPFSSKINACCTKVRNTYRGSIWRYEKHDFIDVSFLKRRPITDIEREAQSKRMKGKACHTEDEKRRISERMKGNKHGLGKVFSEERKNNISIASKNKSPEKCSNTKIILNNLTGIFYYGFQEAGDSIGIKTDTLHHHLNGLSNRNKYSQFEIV